MSLHCVHHGFFMDLGSDTDIVSARNGRTNGNGRRSSGDLSTTTSGTDA